ncbi:MAG TPA: penicillin-binding protein 2 [Solirubrobacterales bacterium]|nr:penicillin-binding protein 2 [Solirubrobacterales bacterium]
MSLIERRVGLLFACFVSLLAVVLVRAVWVQGVQGGSLAQEARGQQTETVVIPGSRGTIFDRAGRELAVSEDAATVFATPYQVKDSPETAHKLAKILDANESEILERLTADSGFEYVNRKVSLDVANQIAAADLKGIGMMPDSRRIYPQGELAGQVIGTVGTENQGLTGLEASEDAILHGTDGEREVVRDALGDELKRDTVDAAETGADLKLTIDANIQAKTEEVLAGLGQTYDPAGATAIVMDPRSSEVLAMANWPGIDPSDPSSISDPDLLGNMATGFTYEPGSTFKAFTVAGALEDGVVTPQTMYDLPPTIQVADREIEESHPRGFVSLTVADILAQSSNVGAVMVGLDLNDAQGDSQFGGRFDHWVREFGFGAPTGVPFPGEEQGILISPDEYSGSTMGNLPIGQGLSVTPMQMASAYAAIASDGVVRTPRLILEEDGEPVEPGPARQVISAENAAKLREMLEGVLAEGGTASEVQVDGYTLAGKTGTAEKVDPETGRYSETEFVASFVGFAPAENPELLVAIVVDTPAGGDYYGGTVAAPAFGEIANFALPYLGIPPS